MQSESTDCRSYIQFESAAPLRNAARCPHWWTACCFAWFAWCMPFAKFNAVPEQCERRHGFVTHSNLLERRRTPSIGLLWSSQHPRSTINQQRWGSVALACAASTTACPHRRYQPRTSTSRRRGLAQCSEHHVTPMHLAKLLAGGAQHKPGIVRPQASSATEPAHPFRRSLRAHRYDDWTTYTPWLENACTSKARFRAALAVPRRAYSATGYSGYSRTKFRQLSGSTSAISLLKTFTFSHSTCARRPSFAL